MKLNTLLIGGFLGVALLIGIVSGYSLNLSNQNKNSFSVISEQVTPAIEALENVRAFGLEVQSFTKGVALMRSESPAGSKQEDLEDSRRLESMQSMMKYLGDYEEILNKSAPDDVYLAENIRTEGLKLHGVCEDLIRAKREGKSGEDILQSLASFRVHEQGFLETVDEAISIESDRFATEKQNLASSFTSTSKIIINIGLLAIILAIALGLYIFRLISKPLNTLSKTVDEISQGNLDVKIKKTGSIKEINILADSLDRAMTTMKRAIKRNSPRKKSNVEEGSEEAKEVDEN